MKRLVVFITTLLCLAAPATAFAYNPLDKACNTNGAAKTGSSACSVTGKNDPIAGPNGALKKASLIIAVIAGVAAVIIIIVAGLEFVTAGGDAQKAANARNAILGAVIGIIIITAAESIIVFVVSKV